MMPLKLSIRILMLFLVGLIAGVPAQAGTRCVLVEYFSKVACDPCTLTTAILDSLTDEYPDSSLAIIQYRPLTYDPFYRPASATRKTYYSGFMSYPTAYFDGVVRIVGAADTSRRKYKETIEDRLAIPSPLNMSLAAVYDTLAGGGHLTAQVEAVDSVDSQNLRLRYALIESGLVYQEKRYQEVLQDMFPDAEGSAFTIAQGEIFQDTVDFDLNDLWIPEDCSLVDTLRIACVAYVQDNTTKEILQSIQIPLALPADTVIVGDVAATLSGSHMYLAWSPVIIDRYCRPVTVNAYRVYRCSGTYYDPGTAVLLDSTTESFYLDNSCVCVDDLLENCFYFVVVAAEGSISEPSGAVGEMDHYLFEFK